VRPREPFTSVRRYIEDTNVLETTFTTERGRIRLVDLMPVSSEADKRRDLAPEHEVLRAVEGVEGEVDVEVFCDPRPAYGAVTPRLHARGRSGYWYTHRAEAVVWNDPGRVLSRGRGLRVPGPIGSIRWPRRAGLSGSADPARRYRVDEELPMNSTHRNAA
jgi:hypothetical protein